MSLDTPSVQSSQNDMYSATWVIDRVCSKCMNKNTYTKNISPPKFWMCPSCGGHDYVDNLYVLKYTNHGIEKIKPLILPHFWVRTQDIGKVLATSRTQGVQAIPRPSPFVTLAKEPVTRVDFKTTQAASKVHYALGNDIPLEGDRAGPLVYLKQWMEESNLACVPVYDRVLFFDLECNNESGFPVPEYDPIVSIGMIINGEEIWLHGPEVEMLKKFWDIIHEKMVQMVVAWNGLEFDFEYIKSRSKKFGINVDFDCVRWLDLMAVYRYIKAQRVRNDLDSAGMDTVGRGKKVHGRKDIRDLEKKGLLEDYNMEDCRIMVDIDKKLKLIPIMTALANEGRVFPDEALGVHADLSTPSPLIDSLILYESHQRKYVLPTKKRHNAKPYKGAIVLDPKAGLYKNILQLDFSSLYPSSMISWRISFDPEEEIIPTIMRKYYAKKESSTSDAERQATKIVLNACFTADTSYMSITGPKNVRDAKIGERVVNINPKTLRPEIDTIVDVQELDYTGDMYVINGSNMAPLLTTAEHKFLIDSRDGKTRFITAERLSHSKTGVIPRTEITDIRKIKPHLLHKFLPLAGVSDIQLLNKVFLKSNRNGGTRRVETMEQADKILVMATMLGYSTTIAYATPQSGYIVSWSNQPIPLTSTKAERRTSRPLKVYCVTTAKNHTLFAGRSGSFVLTGQSYGVFASQYFRLYRPDLAEEIAKRARDFFTSANEILSKLGLDVLYGDSVIGNTEIIVKTAGMTVPRSMRIESLWNLYAKKAKPRIDGKEEIDFRKLKVMIKTQAITKKGTIVTAPINAIIRNEAVKPCFSVRTATGKRLILTKDHALIGVNGIKMTPTEAVGKKVVCIDGGKKTAEKVLSVVPVEVSPYVVYDLDVEGAHTFVANGVFVSNTDSAFIHLGDYVVNKTDAKPVSDNIMTNFNKMFNDYWDPRVKDNTFKVKFVPSGFWSELLIPARAGGAKAAKKRYAGYILFDKKWHEQPRKEPEVTGLELIRSDWAELAKEVQKTLIEMKLDSKPDAELRNYINMIKEGLFAGKYNRKLVIRKGIAKVGRLTDAMRDDPIGELRKLYSVDTPVIKALAVLKKEEAVYFLSNKFVEFVMVIKERPFALVDPDVLPPNIDYRWYFKKQIVAIAERLGIDYEEPTAQLDQWS